MKILLPLGLAVAAAGCAGPEPMGEAAGEANPQISPIMIHFQYGFRTNKVELQMDRQTIFSGVLTTDDRIGLAKKVPYTPQHAGPVDAWVVVDGSERYVYRIRPSRGRNVGFYKDLDSGKLHMLQKEQSFLYD